MYIRILTLIFCAIASAATADTSSFGNGPVFEDFGPVADVDVTLNIPEGARFKHSFDTSVAGSDDKPISTLTSVARFINMHARAGVPTENIEAAIVVHGKAVMELADEDSASAQLIAALTDYGVRIIVCGQSAAYYDVANDDLLPGVEMSLSAMTAHALLQQRGFTLNPF